MKIAIIILSIIVIYFFSRLLSKLIFDRIIHNSKITTIIIFGFLCSVCQQFIFPVLVTKYNTYKIDKELTQSPLFKTIKDRYPYQYDIIVKKIDYSSHSSDSNNSSTDYYKNVSTRINSILQHELLHTSDEALLSYIDNNIEIAKRFRKDNFNRACIFALFSQKAKSEKKAQLTHQEREKQLYLANKVLNERKASHNINKQRIQHTLSNTFRKLNTKYKIDTLAMLNAPINRHQTSTFCSISIDFFQELRRQSPDISASTLRYVMKQGLDIKSASL